MLVQFAAPRAFVRALAVCVSLALAVALGCGGDGGSQAPILDGSEYAVMVDVPALLESSEIPALVGALYSRGMPHPLLYAKPSELLEERLTEGAFYYLPDASLDPAEWKEELRDDFEDDGFEPADSISVSAYVGKSVYNVSDPLFYTYIAGGLDFAAYSDKLDDDEAEGGGYRGFAVWVKGSTTHAILEDKGLVVRGNGDAVNDVLKAFDRGEGFADETDPLKRALDKTGGGLVARASVNCENAVFPFSSSACKAVAETVKGGDSGKTEIVGVYLFSSERRAQSGLDDIEDLLHESSMDADFEEIKANGEFVTYRATIYAP